MKALRLKSLGLSPELLDVIRTPSQSGFSRVRMLAATVGHLDAQIASGHFPIHPQLPYTPGVEGAGEVLESASIPVGMAVTVRGAGVGVIRDGTWCEEAIVPDEALMPAPQGMHMPLAASYFVPATTAFVALHDLCAVGPGSFVLITGGRGAVGSLAVQLALKAGASVVVLTRDPKSWPGPSSDRLTVCASDSDVTSFTGRTFDCLIETVGGAGLERRLSAVKPGGICALVGYASSFDFVLSAPAFILNDVTLAPVNMLRREERAREVAPVLATELLSGELVLPVSEYSLDQIDVALHDVAAGLGGRAVLTFTPD